MIKPTTHSLIARAHPALKPVALASLLLCQSWAMAQTAATPTAPTETVEVIGTSPLPGQGVPREALPYTTHVIKRKALEEGQADNLSDHLARRVPGVLVNDIQGSPFQGDLSFRGYRASGLLGAPQGLSVYLDGVRVNEPFGDVVNWDLIPEFSVDALSLVPGANPAFGLNSLGGAIAMTTATGRSAPGLRADLSLGSFGRKRLDASHGAVHEGGWNHYVAVGGFEESGWRDHSKGDLAHVNAKLGHSGALGQFSLGLLHGQSTLIGNGLVPWVTLDEDGQGTADLGALRRSAVYTHPDLTRNRLSQLTGSWSRSLDGGMNLESLVWWRDSRRETVNGDEADEVEEGSDANASLNRTLTTQRGGGLSLALSGRSGAHQWQVGGTVESARVRYEQTEQEGEFDDTRGVVPEAEPAELSAKVVGSTRTIGLYATDTFKLGAQTHVTGTLRFNQTRVSNQLDTVDDDSGELEVKPTETFTYRTWNPALGLAHRLEAGPTLFGNVARNTRVPTVIELGCADPEEPCRLPAGLQADPYLKPVVSTSLELGARFGGLQAKPGQARGSITVYRTDNRDDILFSSVSVTGQLGYFRNFDRTRHQGLDAEVQRRWGAWTAGVGYSYLEATYQADGVIRQGERNVTITPGTRLAGLPKHQLKLALDGELSPGWTVGLDAQLLSSRGVAGNEDGLLEDGDDDAVRLKLPGYGLLNLRTSWKPASLKGVELFANVRNVFNRQTQSFGALAETQFDAQGRYIGAGTEALFVAPGAPRAFQVGVRVRL
jgi:outer membrane cobalamin receptor